MLSSDSLNPGVLRQGESRTTHWIAAIALTIAGGAVCYWQLYSSFAPYDDEGYVHLSLRMYRAGHPLYDEVSTQYGPACFLLQDVFHDFTRLPITHDVARAKTLVIWLLIAALASVIVHHLTGHWWAALLAAIGLLWHLDRFAPEPGHPQELGLLLLLLCVWSVTTRGTDRARRGLTPVLLGLLTGTVLMVKINLGVLTGLACTGMFVAESPASTGRRWLTRLILLAGALLPWMLFRSHAVSWDGAALPLALTCGWVGIAIHIDSVDCNSSPQQLFQYVSTTLVTALGFAAVALTQGTSPAGLWHGLVGQHQGFLDLFYHHPPLPVWAPLVAIIGVASAMRARWDDRITHIVRCLAPAVLLVVSLQTFTETWHPIAHGLDDRAAAGLLAACITPFAWLILSPPSLDSGLMPSRPSTGRILLALMTVTQPLAACPTPGTQLAIGTVTALLVLVVLTSDLLAQLAEQDSSLMQPTRQLIGGLVILSLLTLACRGYESHARWNAAEPLELPGAKYLRLERSLAVARRAAVAYLREHADAFVASPTGCCSLYLWSEIAPPTRHNVTFWEVQLNEEQQDDVIAALNAAERPLLVVDRTQAPIIYHDAPLNQYLDKRFTTREVDGLLEVWSDRKRSRTQVAHRH